LNYILTFIKDWVPSIAVIVAGGWILFQWLFGEWLRRQKEGPALDGKLSATVIPCENDKLLVTVEALWNNHSPFPVYMDLNKCRMAVFRVNPHAIKLNSPVVLKKDLGEPVCDHHFLVGVCEKNYFLEPNTASTIINHFVLEPGVYGIRMELHPVKFGENWWKEMVLDARHPKSKTGHS
jgi:hypothetical protein